MLYSDVHIVEYVSGVCVFDFCCGVLFVLCVVIVVVSVSLFCVCIVWCVCVCCVHVECLFVLYV